MPPRLRRARRFSMTDAAAAKLAARAQAVSRRKAAAAAALPGAARRAAAHALSAMASLHGTRVVSAYLPIRSEIDSMPLMLALRGLEFQLCLPVVRGPGMRLEFRTWSPGDRVVTGAFRTSAPEGGEVVEPQVLFVPLLAFDDDGFRLGYGGGFFDRTLAELRAAGEVHAFGFAWAAQRVEHLPREVTDARLDAIVTETGIHRPA